MYKHNIYEKHLRGNCEQTWLTYNIADISNVIKFGSWHLMHVVIEHNIY